jgi:tetratricopeptide (TPR) repeat protein
MLDVQCFGDIQTGWAGGHHLVNVFLHAASTLLLFFALRQMTGVLWRSALVALMFAIHPLRAESVAWVAERKDVLSGMFWMLTLFAYSWYVRRPSIGRYSTVFLSLFLGLCSKSMLVTLPCVLLLLDYWPLRRWQWGSDSAESEKSEVSIGLDGPEFPRRPVWWLVVEKLPLFALSAAVSSGVVYAQKISGAMNMAVPVPFGYRISNALVSCVMYLWKTIWPENLAFFYPHPAILGKDPLWWTVLQASAAGTLLAAITLLAIWNVRRRPYWPVGWFWYLGTLVPVIGLIQVGIQGMADRYTYIPTIGIYILVVWGAVELAASHARFRIVLFYATPIVLVLWIFIASVQVSTWSNSLTVFKHAIDVTQNNYFAYNHYGLVFDRNGNPEKAREEYKKSVDIAPHYDAVNSNLGSYYANKGDYKTAIGYYQNAIRVNPFFYGAYANLGKAFIHENRIDEAIAEFRSVIEIASKVSADDPQYHELLALCLSRKGETREALAELRESLRMSPTNPNLMSEIAWTLATSSDDSIRNGEEAVDYAQQAVNLTDGQEPMFLSTLAAAQAEGGRFPEALQTAHKALELATRQNKQSLASDLKIQISHYEAGMPIHVKKPPPIDFLKQP